ncbi:SMR family transporter [Helicobacter sp. T3_23-1059]
MIAFLLVVFSGLLDVFANLALAKSNGFKNLKWGILALLLVDSVFLFLAFALDLGMELPVAYTLWGAIGILGTVVGGYYYFGQKLKPIGFVGIVLVLIAVYLLHFA